MSNLSFKTHAFTYSVKGKLRFYWRLATASPGFRGHDLSWEGKVVVTLQKEHSHLFSWLIAVFTFFLNHKHSSFDDACPC